MVRGDISRICKIQHKNHYETFNVEQLYTKKNMKYTRK